MSNSALMSQLVQQQTSPFQPQQQTQGGIPGKGGGGIPGKGGGTPTVGIPGAGFRPVMAPPVQMPQPAMGAMQRGVMGSPNFRDQAMAQVMTPFAQPNWGVPMVPGVAPGAPQPAPGVPPPGFPGPGFPQPAPRAPFPRLLGPGFPGAVR